MISSSLTKDKLTYICFSDIHLGHPKTKASYIVNNLRESLKPYYHREDLDIIFIAGDLFDRLLTAPSDDFSEALIFMGDLLSLCTYKNIKLRILEGTPSHDWNQSRQIESLLKLEHFKKCDVKYIETLHIEYINDLGIYVLYVPDEYHPSTDKTLNDVKELMRIQGLTQVDLAIMHGHFNFQLPPAAKKAPRHDEQEYLKLVKYFINIGHDHSFAVFERIIAQGSFDRLVHGEEEPKGFVECHIYKNNHLEFFFIENKKAKKYITLNIIQKDVEQALKYINKKITHLDKDSYIRIKAKKDHPIYNRLDELKTTYPFYNFTKIGEDEDEIVVVDDIITSIETPYNPISLTRENLEMLLIEHIQDKYTLDDNVIKRIQKRISENV